MLTGIPEQTPPKLLPYLPSNTKGEQGLHSDYNVRASIVQLRDYIRSRVEPLPLLSARTVTIQQIGILRIASKMFAVYCCIAIQMWLLLNR